MSDLKSVMYETAQGLHRAGGLDKVTLREIESLCLPGIKKYSAQDIKRIRTKARASQGVFARYLNISASTVQKWETGQKKPAGASLKLLNIIDERGLEVLS